MEMRMEMKASLCVGEYCETAYNIEELEIRVYCMEELCYCLKENAFLLDMSIMNDKLVDWIGEECRVRELAKQLYPMVHKQGSLSAFVLTILQYVGIYGEEELQAVAQVLKQGSGLSNLEKRKSQIDYMVEKRKYAAAIRGYDMLLETWSDLEREGRELPAGKVRAAILHNKGVALTGLMLYDKAAEYFREAWQADPDRSHLDAYLAAKRMELTEDAVVYDVGAGTGSVSVEAALSGEQIKVYAIEKNPEAVLLLEKNRRKFRTDGIRIIEGSAPEALVHLEPPTHLFIGGSSGNLKEILTVVKQKNPNVKIVISAISLETVRDVMDAEKEGLLTDMEVTQIYAARSRVLGQYHMMTGMNPVYIISAGGKEDGFGNFDHGDLQRKRENSGGVRTYGGISGSK